MGSFSRPLALLFAVIALGSDARASEPRPRAAPAPSRAPVPAGLPREGPSFLGDGAQLDASAAEGAKPWTFLFPSDEDLFEPAFADTIARGIFVDPLRLRWEDRDDLDQDASSRDRDTRYLFKVGAGVDARPVEAVRGRAALRIARTWGRDVVPRGARFDNFGQDALDLYEGFVELGPKAGIPLAARVGRQELSFGEGRLLAPQEFGQNSRSFDAGRLRLLGEGITVDAFWGRVVHFRGHEDKNFNVPFETTDVFGLYGSWKLLDETLTLEPFYLAKYDDNRVIVGETGRSAHHILLHAPGFRAVWKPLPFILWVDAILQVGEFGPDEVLAYGLVGKAAWRAPEWLRPLFELEAEGVHGSGDRSPTDGRRETLDGFYPAAHKFLGEADLVSWQNSQVVRLTTRLELFRCELHDPPPERDASLPPRYVWQRAEQALAPAEVPVTLEASFLFLWLASGEDAWYNALFAPVRRDPTGKAGRELGHELDIVLRTGGFSIGYSHFFPGAYVRRTTPAGGDASGTDLVYVEYAVSF